MPHPLEHLFELRVNTDGRITPVEAMQKAMDSLIDSIGTLEDRVEAEIKRAEASSFGMATGLPGGLASTANSAAAALGSRPHF